MAAGPIHLITDGGDLRTAGRLAHVVSEALIGSSGAISHVHLREQAAKSNPASDDDVTAAAEELLEICREHGAKLIINRRLDIATAVNADGVHLGGSISGVESAKSICTSDFVIGYSAHSADEAAAAVEAGADYVYLSPIFDPISKPAELPALGLEALKTTATKLPGKIIALGGISLENAALCRDAGAAGIALIGSLVLTEDPKAAAAALAHAWLQK
ncbi:MAG: thiamine phosphate synthase [Bdellovibrionales bacterium]|nr:thiamine phosphate synthase [Bdellovibrionales bacterium]